MNYVEKNMSVALVYSVSVNRGNSLSPLSNEDVLDFAAIFELYISLLNNLLSLFPRSYLIPCLSISFQSCAFLFPDISDSAIVTLQILSALFFPLFNPKTDSFIRQIDGVVTDCRSNSSR